MQRVNCHASFSKAHHICGVTVAFAAALLACAVPAYAAPKDELEQTQREIQESQARAGELAAQTGKLEEELLALQKQLVELVRAQQKNEAEAAAMEDKLRLLKRQTEEKSAALEKQKTTLAGLVSLALRLSRVPPESVVMMPESSQQTMKASRALSMASAHIKDEMHRLNLQVQELAGLQEKLAASRDALGEATEALAKQKQSLAGKLAQRKLLQSQLNQRQTAEKARIAELARKAEDLQQLISSIESAKQEARARGKPFFSAKKGKLRSFAGAKGEIPLPAPGRINQLFGKARGQNETSKGIAIAARSRAQVVAPYDGEVVYAGSFLNYGRLVILRHSDDFHTLLSGLTRIDVNQGEFLLEGEPIGAMGEDESKNRLYVELRKNNQPVDPLLYLRNSD